MPGNIGTLHDVIADHWKQETPVYHYLLLISACFVFVVLFLLFVCFLHTCRRCTFKEVLLAQHCYSTGKKKKTIHIRTCKHVYQLVYFFFIYKKEKNATKKKVLEITGGLSSGSLLFHAFRYFTEVLLFNTILQFFFVQLNCVMNGYYYFWPKFSTDTSTNALRKRKKHLNAVLLIFYW